MSVYVKYDNKFLIPAPLYTIGTEYIRSESDAVINVKHTITLTGSILPNRGSPSSSGNFYAGEGTLPADEIITDDNDRFRAIQKKQEAITELFSLDGKGFEIFDTENASGKIACTPIIRSVSFSEGVNVDVCAYSITLDADNIYGNGIVNTITDLKTFDGLGGLEGATNLKGIKSISIQPTISNNIEEDSATYTVGLSVNVGCGKYGSTFSAKDAMSNARTLANLIIPGFSATELASNAYLVSLFSNNSLSSGVIGGYTFNNIVGTEGGDHISGTYNMSVNFQAVDNTAVDATVTDDYTVEFSKARPKNGAGLGFNNTISINGTITGKKTDGSTKMANAKAFWEDATNGLNSGAIAKIISRIFDATGGIGVFGETATGWTTDDGSNITPVSVRNSSNKRSGTISYSYEFLDKGLDLSGTPFSDVDISVSDQHDANVLAIIPIIGRENGPIIQDIGTKRERIKSISANFELRKMGSSNGLYKWSELNTLRTAAVDVIQAEPFNVFTTGGFGSSYYVTNWSDSLNALNGTFSVTLSLLEISAQGIKGPEGSGWENP